MEHNTTKGRGGGWGREMTRKVARFKFGHYESNKLFELYTEKQTNKHYPLIFFCAKKKNYKESIRAKEGENGLA